MKQTRVAIYTRVSLQIQSNEGQEHDLRAYAKQRGWKVWRVYADKISGVKSVRPALDELLQDAKKGRFDYLAVWRIDRLGRSVSHLLEVLETLKALRIGFVSFSEAIDTSTPAWNDGLHGAGRSRKFRKADFNRKSTDGARECKAPRNPTRSSGNEEARSS